MLFGTHASVDEHEVAHQDDHAFVEDLQVIEDALRMWQRIRYVHDISCLQDDDGNALEQVLVLLEVGQWEAWREGKVYHHEFEPPHAEDRVVEEATGLVDLETLIKGVPLLLEAWSVKVTLVLDQEHHHE